MWRYCLVFLIIFLSFTTQAKANLFTCADTTKCEIALWDSSLPTQYIYKTISLIPPRDKNGNPIPIAEDNQVTFQYDGQTHIVTCDGSWQNLGSNYPEIANKISCTVDRSDVIPGTKVTVNLVLYDQRIYENVYAECPGYTIDSSLQDTDESLPFCISENKLADISACKWQKQNVNDPTLNGRRVPLNQWVVYSKTTVNNLAMSYEVPTPPPYDEDARLCVADDGDAIIEEGEIAQCISTSQGYLCPLDLANCSYEYVETLTGLVGTVGDNYWEDGTYIRQITINIPEDSKVWAARICNMGWDDAVRVYVNDTLVWQDWPGCYERGINFRHNGCINISTAPFVTGTNTLKMVVCVRGLGEGWFYYELDIHKLACPLGNYPCMNNGGLWQCSPHSCEQFGGNLEEDDTQEGANDKQNDGEIDENGNCLGTIYFFNGRDRRCRHPGVATGWMNCCSQEDVWFGLGACRASEQQLAHMRKEGMCHKVGEYCSTKFLGICLQKKSTYCCFNSKLGRIVQEQGRPQLGIDWGEPKSPNCRGFTPEEFQKLDFSKMDLSEFYQDVQEKAAQATQNIQEKTQKAIEQLEQFYQ